MRNRRVPMQPDYTQQPEIKTFSTMHLNINEPEVLANGVRIYVVDGCAHDINRIAVAFGGGSFDETKPMAATLLASMTVHGSAK